jgi:hypothetical protein
MYIFTIVCISVAILCIFTYTQCRHIKYKTYVASPSGYINCTQLYKYRHGERTIVFYKKGNIYVSYDVDSHNMAQRNIFNTMIYSLRKYNNNDIRIKIGDEYYVSINKCYMDNTIEQLNKDMINVATVHFYSDKIEIHEYCAQYSKIISTYKKFYHILKDIADCQIIEK